MKAFEIHLNDIKVCTAGLKSGKGVLSTIINLIEGLDNQPDTISISVSGLNSASSESMKWVQEDLKIGDRILLEVVDTKDSDAPQTTKSHREELSVEYKLKMYHRLKGELSEHLDPKHR
ncbi:MAG: hypothetical protein Q8S11_11765 [Daejeonella sp.]|uniref:hypothetical protein n=1 Tax=Daejeonella sp. TaxID=2805397 RepID=UPI002733DA5C|nr:hypothetical protein [Daejeonella sp.]MDP3469005.1 hypothetical protein [Daejeonella sp.]